MLKYNNGTRGGPARQPQRTLMNMRRESSEIAPDELDSGSGADGKLSSPEKECVRTNSDESIE